MLQKIWRLWCFPLRGKSNKSKLGFPTKKTIFYWKKNIAIYIPRATIHELQIIGTFQNYRNSFHANWNIYMYVLKDNNPCKFSWPEYNIVGSFRCRARKLDIAQTTAWLTFPPFFLFFFPIIWQTQGTQIFSHLERTSVLIDGKVYPYNRFLSCTYLFLSTRCKCHHWLLHCLFLVECFGGKIKECCYI